MCVCVCVCGGEGGGGGGGLDRAHRSPPKNIWNFKHTKKVKIKIKIKKPYLTSLIV